MGWLSNSGIKTVSAEGPPAPITGFEALMPVPLSGRDMLIGAHTSIAGGVFNAVDEQVEYDGNCGQIFSHSPQVWQDPNIDDDEAQQFRDRTDETGVDPWVIHSSYLVNLCTPKDDLREKSIDSMQKEVDAAAKLGIEYVNVHLGAHTGAGVEGGLDNAASALDELDIPEDVTVLIESDAGSGTKLGGEFEHLAGVLDRSEQDLGICLDTAHMFAAGYDLSTAEGVADTVEEFDDVVGLEKLACIHLNDSKHDCGTNKDEHALLGEGLIGEKGISAVVSHEDLRDLPFVLETPTEDGKGFAWNVERARELRD
jgi:deoxyribonuclease-4